MKQRKIGRTFRRATVFALVGWCLMTKPIAASAWSYADLSRTKGLPAALAIKDQSGNLRLELVSDKWIGGSAKLFDSKFDPAAELLYFYGEKGNLESFASVKSGLMVFFDDKKKSRFALDVTGGDTPNDISSATLGLYDRFGRPRAATAFFFGPQFVSLYDLLGRYRGSMEVTQASRLAGRKEDDVYAVLNLAADGSAANVRFYGTGGADARRTGHERRRKPCLDSH